MRSYHLKFLGSLLFLAILVACGGRVERPWEGIMAEEGNFPVITSSEREIIREFYRDYEWPPTVTAAPVPEAPLEERIEVSAELPPGLGGMALPQTLRDRLSPLPQGYARFLVGSDVILMNSRTREVIDVVRNVLQ